MMKQAVAGALCAAGLLMLVQAQAAPARAAADPAASGRAAAGDARFSAIHRAEWQWRLQERLASDESERGRVANDFARVDAIDPAGLSAPQNINYQVYRAQIAAFVEALRFREYEQPVNADSAFWTDVTHGVRQPFARVEDYRNYLARLGHLPRHFGEQLDNMRAGLARGFTPPCVTLPGRDAALASVAEAAPEDTVFYTPFKTMPAALPAAGQAALRAEAVAVIRGQVQPAYAAVLAFMRTQYMPGARAALAAESLPALTLHESAPGHAFQMPVALEQKGVPPFRRAYISAFGEGWALYTERLGTEMGIYETPYEVFGMLSYQAWRAARLVVDTGIHARGWTREQAQAYLRENTALSEHEVTTEVDRYISWPGQALSYYLGQMAIMEARAKAEKALGSKFDIRAFQDTVLQLGSVPLPVLAARIDRFIAEGGKSPYPEEG